MPVLELYSTVRSLAPARRFFGFLGAHGVHLDPGQSYSVPGDLRSSLSAKRHSRRLFESFERAVADGDLVIVKDAALHLYDDTADETKIVNLDDGTLGTADPSWGPYSSSLSL